MKRIVKFFRECVQELKKVNWPTKDDVAISTRVVVISVVVISLLLGLMDYLLFAGLNFVL